MKEPALSLKCNVKPPKNTESAADFIRGFNRRG